MSGDGVTSKYGDGTYTGYVKWFNRTGGWGFLTVTDEEFQGDDIFVYWNSLNVGEEQYRYLLNDEPVTFKISFNQDAKHPYQATDVTGVSGKLMCERRNDKYKTRDTSSGDGEKQHRRPTHRGAGPRGRRGGRGGRATRPTYTDEQGNVWTMASPRKQGRRNNTRSEQSDLVN